MGNKRTFADGRFLRNKNKICAKAAAVSSEERENKLLLPQIIVTGSY